MGVTFVSQIRNTNMKYFLVLSALAAISTNVSGEDVKVGEFNNRAHGIGGTVYAVDEKTLLIKGFTYDGAGPDAFFWAGTEGTPSGVGTILPYPFEGKFYAYEDQSAPILTGQFSGDKDIKLTLPDTLKSTDIKWLSVWCRAFSVNFGDLTFPDGLSLPGATADVTYPDKRPQPPTTPKHSPQPTTELPPPVLSPVDNDISNVHNTHRHDHDADAYPESEPESEPETEPYNGSNLLSCTNLMVLFVAMFSIIVL